MPIPREKIDEVLDSANIVDVIGGYVRLKKAGRNFLGLCPFHTEKTPSFSVSAEKGLFKCFGCGRGGNIFTFLMEHEKISFVEAVKQLAQKYGITIAEDASRQTKPDEGKERLYAATEYTAKFFHESLGHHASEEARQYVKRRKWSEETRKKFLLGFAPDAWDELLSKATKVGYDTETLVTTGLLIKRDDGKMYDRFRRRVVFPIHSHFGKIIGFGARAIRPGDEPKYLNSPETPIYNKSQVLYGLFQAAQMIREKDAVIIVEGYADVLSVDQAGLHNVVATSGTALTPEQIKLLARYTHNFIFIYDADSAGAKAMVRGIEVIIEQGYDVKIVRLPAGDDPDSFVQAKGGKALEELLRSALTFVDFIFMQHQAEGKFNSPDEKSTAVRHVLSFLAKMDDELRRDFYVKHIAEKYDVYETVLHRELDKLHKELQRTAQRRETSARFDRSDIDQPQRSVGFVVIPPAERDFLTNIFQAPAEVMHTVLSSVHVEDFRDERVRHIVRVLMEQKEVYGSTNLAQLEVDVEEIELQRLVAELSIPKYSVSERWSEHQIVRAPNYLQLLLDNYKRIAAAMIDEKILENQKQLKARMPEDEIDLMKEHQLFLHYKQTVTQAISFEEIEKLRREMMMKEEDALYQVDEGEEEAGF